MPIAGIAHEKQIYQDIRINTVYGTKKHADITGKIFIYLKNAQK